MREIDDAAHRLRSRGARLNAMMTLAPDRECAPADAKRWISRKVAHLGQALKRTGREHVGLTVFEATPDLHAHHLVHVPRGSRSAIERFHEPPAVDVRPANGGAVAYITKQHKRLPPDYYARTGLPWREKGHVPGPRFTFTGAARALLAADGPDAKGVLPVKPPTAPTTGVSALKPPIAPATAAPEPTPSPPASTPGEQLGLFDALPEQPRFNAHEVAHRLREERERRGWSQAQVGARLGIRQPHVANVERLHDRLSPARMKAALHLLETGRIAA